MNPRKPVPKRFKERISIDIKYFYFDMEKYKMLFLHAEQAGINWQNLIRELLKKYLIEENKKYQALLKLNKEDEYIPFADFVTDITPRRHFNKDFKAEKITMLGQFQLLHSKTFKPVNAHLVWLNRDVHGITEIKIFEDVLAQLIEEGQIEEIANDYISRTYYTYLPVVPLRSLSKRFNKKNDNPFYERDLERMEKAKQNLKDGTVRVVRKVKRNE